MSKNVCNFEFTYKEFTYKSKTKFMVVSSRIFPEKRKDKDGVLIDKNVPLQLHIFINKKRVTIFNTGFRCNIDAWDYDNQKVKRNVINKKGQSFSYINTTLHALRGCIDIWAQNSKNEDVKELLIELRNVARKKAKGERIVSSNFYELFKLFLEERNLSKNRHSHYLVLKRILERYEMHTQQSVDFNIDVFSFEKYLAVEHTLFEGQKQRGANTITGLLNKLKSFILWANVNDYTSINPFNKYKIKTERYGTPFFLTIEERNYLYKFDFKNRKALAVQRDIFIFQCLVGCRVGDLLKLTSSNVINGFLEYVAGKTKEGKPATVRVPLTETATEILSKYVGNEMLLPFISETKYNVAIKDMFKIACLDRKVTVLNSITRLGEQKPLYEVASSHIARRTFIGNLYKKVQDPNVVGSMSGHAEGSKAFARYRTIDDDIKVSIINLIQ